MTVASALAAANATAAASTRDALTKFPLVQTAPTQLRLELQQVVLPKAFRTPAPPADRDFSTHPGGTSSGGSQGGSQDPPRRHNPVSNRSSSFSKRSPGNKNRYASDSSEDDEKRRRKGGRR